MTKRWAALPRGIRWLAGIAVVVLALAIVWALFVPLADWFAHHDAGSVKGSLHETALDNARGRLLTLGAGLFAVGALVFTARNFTVSRRTLELTEQGQVTDRYTKAIEQLGSDKLDVRIGGIYALERVTRDSARDHPTVIEVLTAFIREHSHEQWPPSDHPASQGQERSTRPDVQAALTVVGRRDPRRDIRSIDLSRADLTGVNLVGDVDLGDADLTGATLTGATLAGADLTDATLTGADLTRADLGSATLTGADLTDATLTGATLAGTDLTGATLTGATLSNANLISATLAGATLSEAYLISTNLAGANLTRAYLSGAYLLGADLDHADLIDANLLGADLTRANLRGADFTRASLIDAELTRAVLGSSVHRDAIFTGANLTGADLTGVIRVGDVDLGDADLTGARLPESAPVPNGWRVDPGSGRLERAHPSSGPAEAN